MPRATPRRGHGRFLSLSAQGPLGEDIMVTFRDVHPFPAEHMRLIGEICILWTYVEQTVLQAVCETALIPKETAQYLGLNVPFGTRVDMLVAVADLLKGINGGKDVAKELNQNLEAVRSAYLLRN